MWKRRHICASALRARGRPADRPGAGRDDLDQLRPRVRELLRRGQQILAPYPLRAPTKITPRRPPRRPRTRGRRSPRATCRPHIVGLARAARRTSAAVGFLARGLQAGSAAWSLPRTSAGSQRAADLSRGHRSTCAASAAQVAVHRQHLGLVEGERLGEPGDDHALPVAGHGAVTATTTGPRPSGLVRWTFRRRNWIASRERASSCRGVPDRGSAARAPPREMRASTGRSISGRLALVADHGVKAGQQHQPPSPESARRVRRRSR